MTSTVTQMAAFETAYENVHNILVQNQNTSYANRVAALPDRERSIHIIGMWDAEVCNGGCSQWISNGYSEFGDELLAILARLEVPYAAQVRNIVRKALEAGDEPKTEDGYDRWSEFLDPLDDEYYTINDAFMQGVAQHFCSVNV